MTILYIAQKTIPSREANSVHVMKMCSAFANATTLANEPALASVNAPAFAVQGNCVALIAPQSAQTLKNISNVYEYYGVPESFAINKIKVYFSRVPVLKTLEYAYKAARYANARIGASDGVDANTGISAGTGNDVKRLLEIPCIYSRDLFTCFFLAVIFSKPFIFEYHEPIEVKSVKGRMFRLMLRSRCLVKMTVITQALKQYFAANFDIDERRIFVAPDGADVPPRLLADVELTEKSNGKYHVGYIGHLYKGRGIELLGDMARSCPFAFFHIIGGNEQDIAYWKDKYSGIENIHLYGHVMPALTASYGKCMDVLIAPYQNVVHIASSNETGRSTADYMSPLKIFEYMALGKPIISSDMPVLKEVLTDGVNALLCPPGDTGAWAGAIKRLHEDKEFSKTLGDNALMDFEKYTWRARADNIARSVLSNVFTRENNIVKSCEYFGFPQKHVFFGYYDLPQISADGTKMLVHIVDKKANPAKDAARIGYFDLADGVYHDIAATKAWCWQQGARLRFHSLDTGKILYNDIDSDAYVTKEADLGGAGQDGRLASTAVVAPALYDISCDFNYGVSLNFARLQRLRPGYGYGILPDKTAGINAPDDDGVFLVDMRNGSVRLVASLGELAQGGDFDAAGEHYINHVSFCPNGRKFIFFHIAKSGENSSGRKIQLHLYDIDTGNMTLIEDKRQTSHYAWCNENELLTTSVKDKRLVYAIYDLAAGTSRVLDNACLDFDGHPSFFKAGSAFISDAYLPRKNKQRLFLYDINCNRAVLLSEFGYIPVKSRDLRCDLHPRLWEGDGGQIITADTTFEGGVRKVALLDVMYGDKV